MTTPFQVSARFPKCETYSPAVPIVCLTPNDYGCFHRFFDTSPISPSGRYVGLTRLRDESRSPAPGEPADIVLIDLETGAQRVVAESYGFGTQLGAQVQWGRSDEELYFNDVDTNSWHAYAVCCNPFTGEKRTLGGPVYMVSPDGAKLASPCLKRTELTQGGYGVYVPGAYMPFNLGESDEDGLYITDTASGEMSLLVSFRDIADALPHIFREPPYRDGAFYGFHVKWNPQGTRLMFILRYRPYQGGSHAKMPCDVVTMDADGSNINVALSSKKRAKGGHHPDWTPDGDHITQNLVLDDSGMRFVRYRYDGTGLECLSERPGSGHPTLHRDGRHILTDAYNHEKLAFGDGTSPLRWVDIETSEEATLARIQIEPETTGPARILRVDPHPAWDPTMTRFVFNACPDGKRQVFLADMSGLVD